MTVVQHAPLTVAKLKARFTTGATPEEVDQAEDELLRRGYIDPCFDAAHPDDCVVVRYEE